MITITNTTLWDNELIKAILVDAGISPIGADIKVNVQVLTERIASLIRSAEYDKVLGATHDHNGTIEVYIDITAGIETLAHELKHVEQYHAIGADTFNAVYTAEAGLGSYESNQWELEARIHGTRWLNMSKGA